MATGDNVVPPVGLEIGDQKALGPNKTYPEGTVCLRVFDTKYGLRWFPVNAEGKPTVVKVSFKEPVTHRILQARPYLTTVEERAEQAAKTIAMVGGKGSKFESCLDVLQRESPEAWDKVERLLARNESTYAIATAVQGWQLPCMSEVKHNTLRGALDRHRQKGLKDRMTKAMTSRETNADNIAQRINVLDTMERMVLQQQTRMEKIYTKEAAGPLLMDTVSKEMDRTVDYLTKLSNLYFEVGIMARAPKVMKGVIASQEMAGSDPIRSSRIVSFELTEEELPLIEGIRNELDQYLVPAS